MSANFTSSLSVERRFLTRTYDWTYDATLKSSDSAQKSLVTSLVRNLSSVLKVGAKLKNVKGRDRLNTIDSSLELPFEHELLAAKVWWNPADFGMPQENPNAKAGTTLLLLTPFDYFEGNDIFHKIVQNIAGESHPELTLDSVCSSEKMELETFRFGMDSFGSGTFAGFFLRTPVVLESILLESSLEKCQLRIQSTNHKAKNGALRDSQAFFAKVLSSVRDALRVDVYSDLQSKLAE